MEYLSAVQKVLLTGPLFSYLLGQGVLFIEMKETRLSGELLVFFPESAAEWVVVFNIREMKLTWLYGASPPPPTSPHPNSAHKSIFTDRIITEDENNTAETLEPIFFF